MNAQLIEDKEGHLFLVGKAKAYDVTPVVGTAGKALRDLWAYSQGDTDQWALPIVDIVPEVPDTKVIAQIFDLVHVRGRFKVVDKEPCINVYPRGMGPAAQVYIFGEGCGYLWKKKGKGK